MKKRMSIFFAAVLTFAMLSGPALGLMPKDKDFSNIVQESEIVVKGKVKETRAKWVDDDRGKHIYTTVIINIDSLLKGSLESDEITLEVVGGTVGEITEVVSSSARFGIGEEVILFLKKDPLQIVAGRQGKISVYKGEVYIKSYVIPVEQFIQALETFIKNPTEGLLFNENAKSLPPGGIQPPTDVGGGQISPNEARTMPPKEPQEFENSLQSNGETTKTSKPSQKPMNSSNEGRTE